MPNRIIHYESFVNDNTINIFTDASISKRDGIWYGSSMAALYVGENMVSQNNMCFRDYTVNESELEAIILGLDLLLRFPNYRSYKVNIFSDSSLTIKGLTEWIFTWYRNTLDGYQWLNYSGQPVTNQRLYMKIIDIVLVNDLKLNFYHINGHYDDCVTFSGYNRGKTAKFRQFINSFATNNKLGSFMVIDEKLARYFILGNSYVDTKSRQALSIPSTIYYNKLKLCYRQPFSNYDITRYSELIRRII